jgi:hypothetical protein
MLSKKTYVALALVVVQVIVLIVVTRSPKKGARATVIPAIAAADVRKIVLSKGSDTVELVRDESTVGAATPDGGAPPDPSWNLKKPVEYAADKAAVKTLLERLEKMTVSADSISQKKEWHDEKFGVGDKAGWKIELFGRDNNPMASFILGKSEGGRSFLRKIGDDAVYQATGIMSYAYDKKPDDWRDKVIFDFKEDQIAKVEVRGAEMVVLVRDPKDAKKWVLEEPKGMKLDEPKAAGVARTMATLRAKEFAAKDTKPEAAGLDKPQAVVTVQMKEGQSHALLIGKKKSDQDVYVKRPDKETIYVIGSWQAEQLHRKPADLKEKAPIIPKPAPEDVSRIVIGVKGKPTTLNFVGRDWRITSPLSARADQNAVQTVLAEVRKLNVPESTWGGAEKHAEFELDDAKGLRVELFGKGGQKLSAFLIGKEDKGQTYLRKVGDSKVYKTYGLNRSAFNKAPEAWRSKTLLSFSQADVVALDLEREGGALRIVRSSNEWKLEKPAPGKADGKKVEELLRALSHFTATDFAPATVKPAETGLDKPMLKVTVELKDRKFTMLLGAKSPSGLSYAKLAIAPEIYLVAAAQVQRIDKKLEDLAGK